METIYVICSKCNKNILKFKDTLNQGIVADGECIMMAEHFESAVEEIRNPRTGDSCSCPFCGNNLLGDVIKAYDKLLYSLYD